MNHSYGFQLRLRRQSEIDSGALALAIALLLAIIDGPRAATLPNIIYVLVDDWGYGDASSKSSGVPMAGIDAIAAAGVTFTDGYATASVCAPSRASALLGVYSQRFGFYDNPGPLPADWPSSFGLPLGAITVAEALRGRGYATAMFGKWHLGGRPDQHPLQRGFDEFFGMIGSTHPYYGEMEGNPVLRGYTPEPQAEYLTDVFAQEAAEFIHRHASSHSSSIFHRTRVHRPYQAKPEIFATPSHITDPSASIRRRRLSASAEAVATVTAALKAEGLYENTLIVLAGDNGGIGAGKTKPLRGRKATSTRAVFGSRSLLRGPASFLQE